MSRACSVPSETIPIDFGSGRSRPRRNVSSAWRTSSACDAPLRLASARSACCSSTGRYSVVFDMRVMVPPTIYGTCGHVHSRQPPPDRSRLPARLARHVAAALDLHHRAGCEATDPLAFFALEADDVEVALHVATLPHDLVVEHDEVVRVE